MYSASVGKVGNTLQSARAVLPTAVDGLFGRFFTDHLVAAVTTAHRTRRDGHGRRQLRRDAI